MSGILPPYLRAISKSVIPSGLKLRAKYALLMHHLPNDVPENLSASIKKCQYAAGEAMLSMTAIDNRRRHRYEALCPIGDDVRSARHAIVINRLFDWKTDYYPANPTLAATPKFERIAVEGICVSRVAYTEWTHTCTELTNYIKGRYAEYCQLKLVCEREIENAKVNGDLDGHTCKILYALLHKQFLGEMGKREMYVQQLAVPTYEELLVELHCIFFERVEDGDVLFQELCDAGTII